MVGSTYNVIVPDYVVSALNLYAAEIADVHDCGVYLLTPHGAGQPQRVVRMYLVHANHLRMRTQ